MTLLTDQLPTVAQARADLTGVRQRGITWLLDHVGPDGAPAGHEIRNGYYRLPWTLAVVGEREAAARVLGWMERNALTPDGDLVAGPPRDAFIQTAATYPLTIMAHGAWLLERYDLAQRIMATLREKFQDPESGGAYTERPEVRATGDQFLFPTAQLGLTALATGHREMADQVFGWFERLWDAQPELPGRLFSIWSPSGLVTESARPEFIWVTDFSQPLQAFYNPGIAAAFLSRYYAASGNPRAKELVTQFLLLSENGTEEQYDYKSSMQVCKFGWGSAMALEIGAPGNHLDNLLHMADWYRDSQGVDGSWYPSPFLAPDPTASDGINKTSEHTLWVSLMLTALATQP
jgi:hypothetical protein